MQVNRMLVDLELITVPGFGPLTARGFTIGDLQDLGWEPDRSLDAEVLVVCPVDEVGRDLFEIFDVSGGQGDPNFVDLGRWNGGTSGKVFLVSLSDVTYWYRVRR